jgi:predicted TIM-barrel fold metal-dependent hydrolase
MSAIDMALVNPENRWRLETPSPKGWQRSVRPGDVLPKYYMISVDAHLMPPSTLFKERLDRKWHAKLPRVEEHDGHKYVIIEGMRPEKLHPTQYEGEDLIRSKSGSDVASFVSDTDVEVNLARIEDQRRDGVDGEVIFPNGLALTMWSSSDVDFVHAQCQVWNDWVWEACEPYKYFCNPAAALATADIEASVKEVERVAKMGFRALTLPCKPIWGASDPSHINYNLSIYDRLWAAIQETGLAITYHVSTGKDPRTARGNGGAVINYVVHSLAPTIEPIVGMCASGVFDRFPKLRAGTIEANAGWVPWMMEAMDEAYKKHHMWVRPKLDKLPSEAFRENCFASFGEDVAVIELIERFGLQDNLLWANDFPHHEGLWPHSAEAIERTLGDHLDETTRRKVLGLNAARIFRFDVPAAYAETECRTNDGAPT